MQAGKLISAGAVSILLLQSAIAVAQPEGASAPPPPTQESGAQDNAADSAALDDLTSILGEEPPQSAPAAAAPTPSSDPQEELPVIPVAQKPEVQSAAAAVASLRSRVLEEIVVTAQRREESAQDVPISITVLDSKQITNANMTNASDLAVYTPSLSANTRFGAENATFTIRGFTQDLRTTASVGTYFAEVVAPRGQSSQTSGDGAGPGALFDLQNVQVLKGPQGTLFGRNTTGGAVLIVPVKPKDTVEGYAEVSSGDFGMQRLQAVFNTPITDSFRIRAGVDRNQRDGHLNNYTHIGADDLGNTNYISARLSAVWDVTDSLENYTILSYVDSDTHGYAASLFACNPNPVQATLGALTLVPCQLQLAQQRSSGNDGFYDLASTIATPVTVIQEKRLINTTTWDISDDLTFKNILAYAHLHTENGSDIFGTKFRLLADPDPRREFKIGVSIVNPNIPVTSQQTWVEEVQLQGSSFEEKLRWQAGAYYEKSTPDGFSGNNSAQLISCELATVEQQPSEYNCFDPTLGLLGNVLEQEFKTEYENRAVYTQATLDFLETLSATVGLRYTWDRTSGYGRKTRYTFAGSVPLAPIRSTTAPEVSSQAPTGLLEFSYRPVDGVMGYVKYIRGYRQGSVILAADPGIDTFDPEKVNTYEIGAKTSFEGLIPGRFNIALFYNDFTDQQLQTGYISQTSGQTTTIFNAGKSRLRGLEAEAFFSLLTDLSLSLSYSYLDTKLIEQEDHSGELFAAAGVLGALTATPIADVGDELPFAPKQGIVASLNYRLSFLERVGEVDLGVTYAYTGEQRATASSSSPYAMMEAFDILNMNLSVARVLGTGLDLSVFATNVLDAEYTTYVSGTYNVLGFDSRMTGQPRMIGARLRYNFGD